MKTLNFGGQFLNTQRIDALRDNESKKYSAQYFEQDYWKEDIPGKSGNRGLAYSDPDHMHRFELLWSGINRIVEGGRFLDIGCGTGILVELGLNKGLDIFGIDISESAVESFHNRTLGRWPNAVSGGNATGLDFHDQAFDTTLCFDVFEHLIVFDIFAATSELCRVTRNTIITSINTDNPYDFHPTILSRDTWIALFEATDLVSLNTTRTADITEAVCRYRPEYDFFVFDRLG